MPKTKMKLAPFALSLGIIVLDQVSKALVVANVRPGSIGFSAFGDFFWLVRQQNLGMAFSLLDKLPGPWRALVLIALPLILVAAVLVFYGLFGFERWPTFNVADSSVVVCAILLVVSTIVADARRRK